jgi:ankyrin repeat protein
MAVHCGQLAVVKVLLEAGADANKAADDRSLPLQMAAHDGHSAVIKALLGSGADLHKTDGDGNTMLIIAVRSDHLAVVEALLEAGWGRCRGHEERRGHGAEVSHA